MEVTVKSKLIEVVSYNEKSHFLKLMMIDGQVREFDDVPMEVVNRLITASSPGTFYARMIRGRFPRRE